MELPSEAQPLLYPILIVLSAIFTTLFGVVTGIFWAIRRIKDISQEQLKTTVLDSESFWSKVEIKSHKEASTTLDGRLGRYDLSLKEQGQRIGTLEQFQATIEAADVRGQALQLGELTRKIKWIVGILRQSKVNFPEDE